MFKTSLFAVLVLALFTGCGKLVPKLDEVIPDKRKEYQKSQSLPDLEVPPDLSIDAIQDRMSIPEGGEVARYSTYQERRADRKRQEDVERSETSAVRLLENEHVFAADGAVVQVWPKLREFWEQQDYALDLDDVELGVLETAWREDEQGFKRDKFKIFAEAGEESGTTVLYVSHEGEELMPEGEELVWQRQPRNVELESVLVAGLQQHMVGNTTGGAVAEASEPPETLVPTPTVGTAAPMLDSKRSAEIVSVGGGKVYLSVLQDFPTAWRTTGEALEIVGVDVENSDKGRGVYYIKVAESANREDIDPGMWNKLKFWDREKFKELQVSLTGVGDKTEVVVLDKDGRWETGDHAGELLTRIHDALNDGRI